MVLMVQTFTPPTLGTTSRRLPDQPHQQLQHQQQEHILDVPQQIHNHRRHSHQMQQTTVSEARKCRFFN